MDDMELIQDPIQFDNLNLGQMMKLAFVVQEKERKHILKTHVKDSELIDLTSDVLRKVMPSYVKDPTNTPSNQLEGFINAVITHFNSLEDSTIVKMKSEFDKRRLNELCSSNT